MKHASAQTLAQIEPLLAQIRGLPGLKEKSRGVFYRRSLAWVHFHEDPAGIFADLRASSDWERLPATTLAQRHKLLRRIKEVLGD
jgi:hypothetical protein